MRHVAKFKRGWSQNFHVIRVANQKLLYRFSEQWQLYNVVSSGTDPGFLGGGWLSTKAM